MKYSGGVELKKDLKSLFKSTTIIGVRKAGKVAMGGDGQVTFQNTIMKKGAKKIRKLHNGEILVGFAGSAADGLALLERFEQKLNTFPGNLTKAVVELAKEWRMDKYLRRLEAILGIMNGGLSFLVSGNGDVVQPDDDIIALGSGGPYALAAARAILQVSNLSAREIVERSLKIASEICIFTNNEIEIEEL